MTDVHGRHVRASMNSLRQRRPRREGGRNGTASSLAGERVIRPGNRDSPLPPDKLSSQPFPSGSDVLPSLHRWPRVHLGVGSEHDVEISNRPHRLTTVDDLLPEAERIFGERLASVIAAGAWLPEQENVVRPWRWLSRESEDRLRNALTIADLLLEEESQETVRAWFVGKNPILGDRAPAIVLADDPVMVRRAARDLMAHG